MSDQFAVLANLRINETMSTSLLELSIDQEKVGSSVAYAFSSSSKSEPHFVLVDTNGKVQEIKLYISKLLSSEVLAEQQQLSSPEFIYTLLSKEKVYAYPSLGKAYILSERQDIVSRIWLFAPQSVEEFASRFEPQAQVDQKRIEMEGADAMRFTTQERQTFPLTDSRNLFVISIASGIFIITAISLIIIYLKRRKKFTSENQTSGSSINNPVQP